MLFLALSWCFYTSLTSCSCSLCVSSPDLLMVCTYTHTHSELEEYTHTRTNALISRQCFIFHTHGESVCIFSTGSHILLLYMPDCFSGSWDEAAWMCVSGGKDKRMRERVKWFWQQTASPARRLTKRLFPWAHWLWPCFWIKRNASQA